MLSIFQKLHRFVLTQLTITLTVISRYIIDVCIMYTFNKTMCRKLVLILNMEKYIIIIIIIKVGMYFK